MSSANEAGETGIEGKSQSSIIDSITWDDFHDSPQAEIVLVSKDMVGFRVYAWYMRKKSDFIKDLLDLPSMTSTSVAPIQLNQTADIVRHFIHCASAGPEQYVVNLDALDYKEHLDLCDFLQAPAVRKSIIKSIIAVMERSGYYGKPDAWEVFKYAAAQDDFELARFALSSFDRSYISVSKMISSRAPSYYADIPPRYVYALFRSFVRPSGSWRDASEAATCFELDWEITGFQ